MFNSKLLDTFVFGEIGWMFIVPFYVFLCVEELLSEQNT